MRLLAACGAFLLVIPTANAAATNVPAAPQLNIATDPNGTVPGVVRDDHQQPVADVTVELRRNGETIGKAVSGIDGGFRLVVPVGTDAGDCTLTVGLRTMSCAIWSGETAPLDAVRYLSLRDGLLLVASN